MQEESENIRQKTEIEITKENRVSGQRKTKSRQKVRNIKIESQKRNKNEKEH